MAQQIHFAPYVGVSPGTTTMTLGGLGTCPPGYYGENIMLPGAINFGPPPTPSTPVAMEPVNPYATETKLEGLRGTMRWDLLILGFGVAFAGVLGYSLYKRKRK